MKLELDLLRNVNGLSLPVCFDEQKLRDYNQDLSEFIETLPTKSYELTKLFIIKDFVFLSKRLIEMSIMLNRIYAHEAVEKCNELIAAVKIGNKMVIDELLTKFATNLSALSIEIQVAGHQRKSYTLHLEENPEEIRHIMVVDDEPVILNALKGFLDGEQYKFSGVTSGHAALRYLEKHAAPDVFILDIEMPKMNGYELAETIMSQGYDAPIIFLTSHATKEYVIKAVEMGIPAFLVKPPDKDMILKKLDELWT